MTDAESTPDPEHAPERDSTPPVAGPPAAPRALGPAAAGLALYGRALIARIAVLVAGVTILVLAHDKWPVGQLRFAIALDGAATAITTIAMMAGLNRFARSEEDGRAGGLAIASVIVLLLELVAGLYATKLRLDLANDAADVVLVGQALAALPYAQTAAHAFGLGSAVVLLAALRRVALRLALPALARRISGAIAFLAVVTVGAMLVPLVVSAEASRASGPTAYELIVLGAAAAAVANYVAVVLAVRRAMARP